jgi:phosphoesterase RecJ-like protein
MIRKITSIVSCIQKANDILVVGHIMPDGDCISSVVSLSMGLEKFGKRVTPAIDWKIPANFTVFPWIDRIKDFSNDVVEPNLIIIVDASSPDRIGRFEQLLRKGIPSVVIDHHATNTYFADDCWVDPSYSSAAQMVLDLLKLMDVEYDADLALMNYIGIATDTGFFRYSNVDSSVFEAAAELVRLGADPTFVATSILETRKIEELFLERDAIDNIKMLSNGRFAYSYLELEDFEKYSLTEDDFVGFVGDLRSIKSVEVALFASEASKGEAHVSLRSKSYFDVSKIAVAFGGGGHQKASGFTLRYDDNLEDALAETIEMIDSQLQQKEKH